MWCFWGPAVRNLLLSGLFLLIFLLAGDLAQPCRAFGGEYEEFFDQQLFHERVKGLNQVKLGDRLTEVIHTLGSPQARESGPGGTRVFIYRVRCYAGPEPGSHPYRHLSLTYEMRLTFDREGRLQGIITKP